jgi:hypothetical protein
MSAKETMPSQGTSTFDLFAVRLHFEAGRPVTFPEGATANLFRGQFGKVLHQRHPELYERWFKPVRETGVPSGLHDPPRPFVFRVRHLESAPLERGQRFHVGINLFETYVPEIGEAIEEVVGERLIAIEGLEMLRLPLESAAQASRVKVHFLTPTELKPANEPEFGRLFARVRDRIATLRSLYGAGPLNIDFRAIGERAGLVRTASWKIAYRKVTRTTGSRHPLGGFTGVAEYEGDLAEFIPYLEIAAYTGVGRQTVWGKGEIAVETF